MTELKEIKAFGRRIGKKFNPQKVLLFGSHAHGTPNVDSDVDILVVMPFEGSAVEQAVRIRMQFQPPFPMDLLVRTPERIKQRIELGDTFIKDIIDNGRLLYEADNG